MENKIYVLSFILIINLFSSQQKLDGDYDNELGETLQLNSDHTFDYKLNVHTGFCWNVGTWKVVGKNQLILNIIEIKDKIIGEKQFVLSHDRKSDSITLQLQAIYSLQGGGQSKSLPPTKFLIKNGILYPYSKEGIIQNVKIKSFMNGNMIKPWFEKLPQN